MDNIQIEGVAQQIKGAVKRSVGKLIGDAKMAEGGAYRGDKR